jgi:hypothetical protein
MKVQRFDSQISRKVLAGMIVHDGVLESLALRLGKDREPFNQRWLDLVARWCLDYFAKHQKAPRRAIMDRFFRYADQNSDDASVQLVERFLQDLGKDYRGVRDDLNEGYIVSAALELFGKVRLQRKVDEVQAALESGDLEHAHNIEAQYTRLETDAECWDDPFAKDIVRETFNKLDQEEQLIHFPGELERFLGPYFKRGDFVSFVGPEKRGKSYWLLEVVWQALKAKRRVLYYALGDMGRTDVYKRLYCRAVRKPLKDDEWRKPLKIIFDVEGKVRQVTSTMQNGGPICARDVLKARERVLRVTASKDINLRVLVSGGGVVSAGAIEAKVHQLVHREVWIPDVVVIDYADELEPEANSSRDDFRHKVNATWRVLRRIALDNHCLVVTATQAAASSYKKSDRVLSKDDFSEDKRKNAHVTGMVGLNQSPHEKEKGIYRLNWMILRGGKWAEHQVCYTAGNLAVSCPCIVSRFAPKKEKKGTEE